MTPIDLSNVRVATALEEVAAEREKQRAKWGDDHDDGHELGELAQVAAYIASRSGLAEDPPEWAYELDQPPRRRALIIAAALLIAEIERLDRLTERESE